MALRLKRYNHNRTNTRLSSFDLGELVPSMSRHCIEGTTLRGGVSAGFQLASLARQTLTQLRIDTYAISAADRILWEDAEDFYTGGETGEVRPVPPYIVAPAETGWLVGSLADHLGFPTGVPGLRCNALPFRLYAYWYNENVIDPNLQQPLPISTASGLDVVTNTQLMRMNWPKDIFTSSVVEEQLGDEVVIPIASSAPVVNSDGSNLQDFQVFNSNGQPYSFSDRGQVLGSGNSQGKVGVGGDANSQGGYTYVKLSQVADLTNATGILPSDFNMAMARQAWKTRRNLFGWRFKDWLSFRGIRYSDRRLQLPSTLGHGRAMIDVNGVLQTAPGESSFVGQRGGTATGYAACNYKTYFEEPTTVIHLTCIRPAPLYVNINPLEWQFEVREDVYTPEFAHVGMAEMKRGTLFPTGDRDVDNQRWSFYNRYDEMRSALNDVSGAMKSTNLVYHQGRVFANAPELNSDFITCNPSPRIFNDMENAPQVEVAAIRNHFVERNTVTPNGDPRFR